MAVNALPPALALFLCAAVGVQAQQAPAELPAAEQQPASLPQADDPEPEPERELTPEELTPDTFDPSEQVSEDLPVAFPVDI